MKKRITAALTAALLLCGCASSAADGTTDTAANGKNEDTAVLVIENITQDPEPADTAELETAVNAITVPAINCKIEIYNCYIDNHQQAISMVDVGGLNIDLISAGLVVSLPSLVSDGTVRPLNDLLDRYGPDLLTKCGDLLKCTTFNGMIYAVPANLYPERSMGIGYNSSIAGEYGITMPDPVTMEDLTAIGQQLKDAGSGVWLTDQGDGNLSSFHSFYDIESFGEDVNYCYGVIQDPIHNTDVVNAYETDEYREYCRTLHEWKEKGLIRDDSLLSGTNAQELFSRGDIFFQWTSVSPATEELLKRRNLDFEEVLVPATPNELTTSGTLEYTWGVASSSLHPDKAVEFLNLLYTDPDLANLLTYGIEGKDYRKIDEKTVELTGNTGSSNRYDSYFSIYGDSAETWLISPASRTEKSEMKKFSEEAQPVMTFGYSFDPSPVSGEVLAVTEVISNYRPVLECGLADDVAAALDEFNRQLDEAGIDRIIEENQRQLDEWLALSD